MAKKTIIILSILVLVTGLIFINPGQFFTKLILRVTGDYKPPQYETMDGILKPLEKYQVHYDRFYRLANYQSMDQLQKKDIFEMPFLQIFNGEKKLIKSASGNECTWSFMEYFTNPDSVRLVQEDSLMYSFILQQLSPVELLTEQDTFDFYVLAGWANFAPKLSKRLFEQTNQIKSNLKDRLCISYINMDFQEGWEEEVEPSKSVSKK